eukprot:5848530-Alexandrium_andersonii.AAC.1
MARAGRTFPVPFGGGRMLPRMTESLLMIPRTERPPRLPTSFACLTFLPPPSTSLSASVPGHAAKIPCGPPGSLLTLTAPPPSLPADR